MTATPEIRDSDIAIVGMACRFPGAGSPAQFWRNLCAGHESTTFFSDEELLDAGVDPALLADPAYVKAGQIVGGAEEFDADYFRMTKEDAELLDPQQRLFLECAVEALEDAAHDPGTSPVPVGVYAGVGLNSYLLHNLGERFRTGSTLDKYRLMLTGDKDFLATRTAYTLDLRGPTVNVSTACSTSLVAVHLACLSLLGGECDLALAGGAHVKVPQVEGYLYQQGMIFSPDGRCRAFDARSQGTIVGDGAGVVALRRLSDAIAERDQIYAVIKGTAINNDGAAKAGYTAPSVSGQVAVIGEAQELAGCPPETISYVEAHGTGTALGDAVEITALRTVFEHARSCAIGSVKTNIGHLDTAAGIAGLIKTALMLRHRTLVPSLHFTEPNPELHLDESPFHVNTELAEWSAGDLPRRSGVSAFGIGGANAHAVLEESPAVPSQAPAPPGPELLVISARTPDALDQSTENLARHLHEHASELTLADVAHTLAVGRRAHQHRRTLVAADLDEAALTLMLGDREQIFDGQVGDASPEVVFVFPDSAAGTGALYQEAPAFARHLGDCLTEAGLTGVDPLSLVDGLDPVGTVLAQCALARLWVDWGVRPSALIAFGAGEPAAAVTAGLIPLDAARVLAGSGEDRAITCPDPATPMWSATAGDWLRPGDVLRPAAPADATVSPADAQPMLEKLLAGTNRLPVELVADAQSPRAALLRHAGRLWTSGVTVDWNALRAERPGRPVSLPTYPFQRRRYWVDPTPRHAVTAAPDRDTPRHRFEAADGEGKVEIVVELIQAAVADILGLAIDAVDLDDDLFGVGLDSLALIEIAARLGADLDQDMPASAFGEHPTIRAYAHNLAQSRGWSTRTPTGPG